MRDGIRAYRKTGYKLLWEGQTVAFCLALEVKGKDTTYWNEVGKKEVIKTASFDQIIMM